MQGQQAMVLKGRLQVKRLSAIIGTVCAKAKESNRTYPFNFQVVLDSCGVEAFVYVAINNDIKF